MSAAMHGCLRRLGWLACALLLSATAGPARGDVVAVRDASGRMVTVRDASRIVSVGGAITEILYALGLERQVVGVDSTSSYPPQALREKPNVGYMRALSPEGVFGLNPSLILATEGSGPRETLAMLQAAGIPFVLVPDPFTGRGIVEKIELVATAAGAAERGRCLAKAVAADLEALAQLRAQVETPLKTAFLLSFVNGKAMVAGRNTAADGIIRLAGSANAISAYEGYKSINDEAIIAARPDTVLAMARDSHPLNADTVFAHPGFALTPAAKSKALIVMNGLYLLGFGPRTALAARDLASTLYPALTAEKLPSERGDAAAEMCRR
jgi:iron complex transport system substrate-binding protein